MLAALPPDELALVEPHLTRVTLRSGELLSDPWQRIETVTFPEDCVVSQLSVMADGSAIETGTVGSDGMTHVALFHGVDATPEQIFVQVPGDAYRMSAEAFRDVIAHCPTLAGLLSRYTVAIYSLVAQSSGCNRKHSVDQRCARWLLHVHDRVGRDRFELTQLFLSQMLGVRRASVTVAAGALQKAGAIRYSRGRITIVDRARLEEAVCECYAVIRSTFDRLLGGTVTPSPIEHVRYSEGGVSTATAGAPAARGVTGSLRRPTDASPR
jgi:CRP-like cAMP-binding protein